MAVDLLVPAPNDPFLLTYLPATSTAASITGPWLKTSFHVGLIFQAIWTGTTAGTFTFEGSLDPDPSATAVLGVNTVTVTASITSPAGGPSSSLIVLDATNPPWVRLKFARSAGTGLLTVGAAGRQA